MAGSATRSEQTYQQLRELLLQGKMAAGERLVTRTLAEQFGVSLAPVREALNRLASEGLVEHVPGAGAFVRKPDRRELEELYVLREAIESCAAAEAALYITPGELAELQSIIDHCQEILAAMSAHAKGRVTPTQFQRWLDYEEKFHQILLESSRNRLLSKVVTEHRAIGRVFESQRQRPELLTVPLAQETCRTHQVLLDALRSRNPALSRQAMMDHLAHGRQLLPSYAPR